MFCGIILSLLLFSLKKKCSRFVRSKYFVVVPPPPTFEPTGWFSEVLLWSAHWRPVKYRIYVKNIIRAQRINKTMHIGVSVTCLGTPEWLSLFSTTLKIKAVISEIRAVQIYQTEHLTFP
jgi:hypothetical protein